MEYDDEGGADWRQQQELEEEELELKEKQSLSAAKPEHFLLTGLTLAVDRLASNPKIVQLKWKEGVDGPDVAELISRSPLILAPARKITNDLDYFNFPSCSVDPVEYDASDLKWIDFRQLAAMRVGDLAATKIDERVSFVFQGETIKDILRRGRSDLGYGEHHCPVVSKSGIGLDVGEVREFADYVRTELKKAVPTLSPDVTIHMIGKGDIEIDYRCVTRKHAEYSNSIKDVHGYGDHLAKEAEALLDLRRLLKSHEMKGLLLYCNLTQKELVERLQARNGEPCSHLKKDQANIAVSVIGYYDSNGALVGMTNRICESDEMKRLINQAAVGFVSHLLNGINDRSVGANIGMPSFFGKMTVCAENVSLGTLSLDGGKEDVLSFSGTYERLRLSDHLRAFAGPRANFQWRQNEIKLASPGF